MKDFDYEKTKATRKKRFNQKLVNRESILDTGKDFCDS